MLYLWLVADGILNLDVYDALPVGNSVRPLGESGLVLHAILLHGPRFGVREQRAPNYPLLGPRPARPGTVNAYIQASDPLLLEAADHMLQLFHLARAHAGSVHKV